jgi:hypothetical protein
MISSLYPNFRSISSASRIFSKMTSIGSKWGRSATNCSINSHEKVKTSRSFSLVRSSGKFSPVYRLSTASVSSTGFTSGSFWYSYADFSKTGAGILYFPQISFVIVTISISLNYSCYMTTSLYLSSSCL